MGNILENFSRSIEELSATLGDETSTVQQVRQKKHDVQQLQDAIKMSTPGIRYVREKNCLIISAPNIIIGNVDSTGRLLSGKSQVIVRGTKISNEASDDTGNSVIRNRATKIENIAVDPGMDGLEDVVFPNSRIINQARAINIQSDNEVGAFSSEPNEALGVNITSDSTIKIDALGQNENRKRHLVRLVLQCANDINRFQQSAESYKTSLDSCIEELNQLVGSQSSVNGSDDLIAVHFPEIFGERFQQFKELEKSLYSLTSGLLTCLSLEAEAMRKEIVFDTKRVALENNDANFRDGTSGTSISLNSEQINMKSVDGDGVIRENNEAGLFVNAPHVQLVAHDSKGALIKNSNMKVNAQDVELSTASVQFDDDQQTTAQIPALGNVTITSKNTVINAVDAEYKDNATTEKSLTQDGSFYVRASSVAFDGKDAEGKSVGQFAVNAKNASIAAVDRNQDSGNNAITTGSSIQIQAENTSIGRNTTESKSIQMAAQEVTMFSKDAIEINQDSGNSVITLKDGELKAGANNAMEVDADTTIKGKTSITGETTVTVMNAEEVNVTGTLKSPTMGDAKQAGQAQSTQAPQPTKTEQASTADVSASCPEKTTDSYDAGTASYYYDNFLYNDFYENKDC